MFTGLDASSMARLNSDGRCPDRVILSSTKPPLNSGLQRYKSFPLCNIMLTHVLHLFDCSVPLLNNCWSAAEIQIESSSNIAPKSCLDDDRSRFLGQKFKAKSMTAEGALDFGSCLIAFHFHAFLVPSITCLDYKRSRLPCIVVTGHRSPKQPGTAS